MTSPIKKENPKKILISHKGVRNMANEVFEDKMGSPITEGDTVVHLWSRGGKWSFEKGIVTLLCPHNVRSVELVKVCDDNIEEKFVTHVMPSNCIVVHDNKKLYKEAMKFITAYRDSKPKEMLEFKLPNEETDVNPYFVEAE